MAETKHSKHYAKVKDWFQGDYWTITMVKNAVLKKWITEEEYEEITGEKYSE